MTDSCDDSSTTPTPHLLVIGGGSAAFSAAIEADSLGARITLVNDGLPMGGTCVNVGCVPSKFLLRAAETHSFPRRHDFEGIRGESRLDYERVIGQKRDLVDELRPAKYENVLESLPGVEYREAEAHFLGPGRVAVDDEVLEPDRTLVATGAAPSSPPIEGLEEVDYLTNETAFELEDVPDSLAVVGGGYIGLECAQAFSRFGSEVTVLDHGDILPDVSNEVSDTLAYYLREEGITVVQGADVRAIRPEAGGVELSVTVDEQVRSLAAEAVLVAAGREPNSERLKPGEAGIEVDESGFVETDGALETTCAGVYAAGDVAGDPMYVYTAAREGEWAARNALSDERSEVSYEPLPWVVFTDPQVAGVGLNESKARERGWNAEATTLPLSEVPRAAAARDSRGFIRLIRDATSDRLLGARIVAPEGGELVMELAVALEAEMTVRRLTDLMHPYLTQSEGIRIAALTFDRDLEELSCCAG